MNDFTDEEPIPIRKSPEHFPKQPNGKKVNIATVYRWTGKGARVKGGTDRVRLEVWKVGGRTYTTVEAIKRFIRRINGEDDGLAGGIGAKLPPHEPLPTGGRAEEIERAAQQARKLVHSSQNAIRRGPSHQGERATPHGAIAGIASRILPPARRSAHSQHTETCKNRMIEWKPPCQTAVLEFTQPAA